ncbi:hypothetical protein SAMN03159391_04658 [Pseudomonas sp. NFACC37-1]|nr:hypothetical protein SAMN03159391_04658 [Pseudomonas sp. NFACC37-1]
MNHPVCDAIVPFVGTEVLAPDGPGFCADKKSQRKTPRYGKLTALPDPPLRSSVLNDQKHEIQP